MPQTTELTQAQQEMCKVYSAVYTAKGLETCPEGQTDFEAALQYCMQIYDLANVPRPQHHFFGTFENVVNKAIDALLASGQPRSAIEGEGLMTETLFLGQLNMHAAAYYDFLRNELGYVTETEDTQPIINVIKTCGPILFFDTHVFISGRPTGFYPDSSGNPLPVWSDAAWEKKREELKLPADWKYTAEETGAAENGGEVFDAAQQATRALVVPTSSKRIVTGQLFGAIAKMKPNK